MEHIIGMEVWMALAGATCITGWLIGDWNGAERMRNLIDSDIDLGEEWGPLKTGSDQDGACPKPGPSSPSPAVFAFSDERADSHIDELNATASLERLRNEAESIRRKDRVWDHLEVGLDYSSVDPVSSSILQNYRKSVENLQHINRSENSFDLAGDAWCASKKATRTSAPPGTPSQAPSPFFRDDQSCDEPKILSDNSLPNSDRVSILMER